MAQKVKIVSPDKLANRYNCVVTAHKIISNGEKWYMVARANLKEDGTGFEFGFKFFEEHKLVDEIIGCKEPMFIQNLSVKLDPVLGKVPVGTSGAFDRFLMPKETNETQSKSRASQTETCVIFSEIVDKHGNIRGYTIIRNATTVQRVPLAKLLEHCEKLTLKGIVPIQNAQFVHNGNEKAHIRCYKDREFVKEVLIQEKNKYVETIDAPKKQQVEKAGSKESAYTKEQLEQLYLGKQSGINYRMYAIPELSPEQMKLIRVAAEKGVKNLSLICKPVLKPDVMKVYIADLKYKIDIRKYLSSKYNPEQISELSLGVQEGINIAPYADPSLNAIEMQEIRLRISRGFWH